MRKDSGFLLMSAYVMMFAWFLLTSTDHALPGYEARSKNNPPVVKIVTPKNNSAHEWNSLVRYFINVSDAEDGESRYEEIPSKEVFLEVKSIMDTSQVVDQDPEANDSPGLNELKKSGCFTCHAVKTKVIGPSFEEIARKYSITPSTKEMLAGRIIGGSTGVWGEAIMPSQPALTPEAAHQMVEWILQKSTDPNLNYFIGVSGTFRMVATSAGPRSAFVITATYIDHGSKDKPNQNQTGRDVIMIRGK